MLIEMLLATFTEKQFGYPLLERTPALVAAAIDRHHVTFAVVKIGIQELGDDMRIAKFPLLVAKTADLHSNGSKYCPEQNLLYKLAAAP
jgi:hypothetical protein